MNPELADLSTLDLASQGRETVKHQMELWFSWMDRILDIHRSSFVFRQATSEQLKQHHDALKMAIRFSHVAFMLIADPDFNEPELVRRLQTRIQQLQDAYDTFHDPDVTPEKAAQILNQVFPG